MICIYRLEHYDQYYYSGFIHRTFILYSGELLGKKR